ncbi:MAG: sugar transferase [Verrucomicrobia bacterium]|nr:sugar transferase [Verrucomicrobiota bacterium]
MNINPADPVSPRLLGHFAKFQSSFGLWKMKRRLVMRRLAWRWFVESADFAKRAMDIVGSFTALFLLSPVLIPVIFLVKLDGGPAIFAQTRVGRFGAVFKMFKFRSMRPDAEQQLAALLAANQHVGGVTFKIKNDPRVTRVGHWLRRFSLDELPQFYNVLIGDMSLVGPRPPVPREVALYTLADRRRLLVKPGITCTWQVGGRANIDFPGQVLLDVSYIENQSLGKDVLILVKTPKAVVFGSGSY